ncbi:hypothetical protein [Streptomyces sp. NPDC000134]|uniref:hypothetical protein n=1 Tax=Streptomyces sp. NPDC000134 TaxID=3364536 RepID=UPI00368F5B99
MGAVQVAALGAASSATATADRYSGSTVDVTTEIVPGLLDPLPCRTTTGLTRAADLSTLTIV